MRQIKFRGKNAETGEWVYGGLSQYRNRTYIVVNGVNFRVDADSVGQFTGLKDKYGTEIYEDDYLRFFGKLSTTVKEVELRVQVVWDERRLLFGYKDIIGNQTQDVQKTGLLIAMEPHQWIVTGNKYDND